MCLLWLRRAEFEQVWFGMQSAVVAFNVAPDACSFVVALVYLVDASLDFICLVVVCMLLALANASAASTCSGYVFISVSLANACLAHLLVRLARLPVYFYICLSFCLSVCLCVPLSLSLILFGCRPACLCACLSAVASLPLSFRLPVFQSSYVSLVVLSVYLVVCLLVWFVVSACMADWLVACSSGLCCRPFVRTSVQSSACYILRTSWGTFSLAFPFSVLSLPSASFVAWPRLVIALCAVISSVLPRVSHSHLYSYRCSSVRMCILRCCALPMVLHSPLHSHPHSL